MLTPSIALLAKLGSIAVHADEFMSPNGHPWDREALKTLLEDGDVREFVAQMQKQALVSLKRKP
jgi:hypothetical protein